MRFTSKSQSFSQNRKEKLDSKRGGHHTPHHVKTEALKDGDIRRTSSGQSHAED
jgi:hypothetical protein